MEPLTPRTKVADLFLRKPVCIMMTEHFKTSSPVGDKSIATFCSENNISPGLFIAIANLYDDIVPDLAVSPSVQDIPQIISYLRNTHRYYLNEIYPEIMQMITGIKEVNNHEEIRMVEKFFNVYFSEVEEHLNYENDVAFPYISNLFLLGTGENKISAEKDYSLIRYIEHHDDIELKLEDLQNLLLKYLPFENDQQIRRKLFIALNGLDIDLQVHTRTEELILVPLALRIENELKKQV